MGRQTQRNRRESMRAEAWYIDIFIAKIVDGWGMCDWESSVDYDLCDM